MFAPLARYLDPSFLQRNSNIRIITASGATLNYRIFKAQLTDAWDIAYSIGISDNAETATLFPNAPENATRFLLSLAALADRKCA